MATLLDPRFKNLHFKDPAACANAIKKLKEMVSNNKMLLSSSSEEETNESSQYVWEYHQGLAQRRTRASSSRHNNSPSDQLVMNYLSTPVTSLRNLGRYEVGIPIDSYGSSESILCGCDICSVRRAVFKSWSYSFQRKKPVIYLL